MHRKELPKHLEVTLNYFNIPNKQIDLDCVYNVYTYGSRCYGTDTEKSDVDYIIVYEDYSKCESVKDVPFILSEPLVTKVGNIELNATLMTPKYFQFCLDQHKIDVMECIFLREDYKHESIKFDFNLNLDQLRRSISAVSSNSWVKCKKKMAQGDDYIGKKSLFHSLRIADFGIQIAKEGKIVSYEKPYTELLSDKYETFSSLLGEIMFMSTWDELKDQYQDLANNLRTEFRIVAPIERTDAYLK